ncbi:uncharacterized protein FFB20_15150 [Fusarium fujikuroi]|nr:uncharacterized protein Y057_2776 [Fusarium fujikuroi]QGI60022.1 hypothetical protein CEK27_003993 [Fusarium fujikuroi]QGI77221.1 hypothetical protein CEK25_003950 [Fusarium fujikuroi]QGI90932.1 hypothetical protein CEK26_004001 [Fusarium fujikuroi]SCN90526.1 uncharacterized protein FFE2_06988 [Fusarium fujikuroi]
MESLQQQLQPDESEKRKPKEHKRSRIEVRLRSKPRDYVPGSGPPLQPISLLPPQDSTAYILERIILPSPGLAADGLPLPRRMTYIVSWTDLPAAQMLVPAMDILEYVSPRKLEEWEFKNTEEQLEEETTEKKKTEAGQVTQPKRRGRPPKHSTIETAVVAVVEDDEAVPMKGAMTIQTPTKNRLKDFEGLSDEEGPARQLQWEMTGDSAETDDQALKEHRGTVEDSESAFSGSKTDLVHSSAVKPQVPKKSHTKDKHFESFPSTGTSSRQSTPQITRIRSKSEGKKKLGRSSKKAQPSKGLLSGVQGIGSASDWTPQESLTYSNSGVETPDPESETQTARLIEEALSVQKKPPKSKSKPKSNTPKSPETVPQEDPSQEAEEADEPGWEVKRLEDMELYDVEGKGLVRYFLVRWEGDWPPDQNPSWEPESNLPKDLIKAYLRNGKRKRPDKPVTKPVSKQPSVTPSYAPKKKSMKQTTLSWGIPAKHFKSVSEAFAGGEEDELGMPVAADPRKDDDEDDELFVVEEPPAKKRAKKLDANGWGADDFR